VFFHLTSGICGENILEYDSNLAEKKTFTDGLLFSEVVVAN